MVLKCADSPNCWKSRATLLHVTGNVLLRGVWMSCLSPAPRLNSFCQESKATYRQAHKHFKVISPEGENIKNGCCRNCKGVWVNRTNLLYLLLKHRLSLLEAHYFRLLALKKYSMSAHCCTLNTEAWCDSLPTCCLINESVPRLRWCLKARLRSKAAVPHWAKGQRPLRTKG